MRNIITKVISGGIADEVEIEVNDVLLSIDGTEIKDIIDYKFLSADEEIVLEIEKPNGEVWEIEVEKEYEIISKNGSIKTIQVSTSLMTINTEESVPLVIVKDISPFVTQTLPNCGFYHH